MRSSSLHLVFPTFRLFWGHLREQRSQNGQAVKANTSKVCLSLISQANPLHDTTQPPAYSVTAKRESFKDNNCSTVQLSWACRWEFRGSIPTLQGRRGIKGWKKTWCCECEREERGEREVQVSKWGAGSTNEGVEVSSSHGGMFLSRKNDFPFTQPAPQGVVHSYTAYASDSNTLPPPHLSSSPSLPRPILPPLRFLYSVLQGTGREGGSQKVW